MRIALIDDDEAVLDSLTIYLGRQGIAVDCFNSAESFLAAETRIEGFDCVVTDVRLPGLSGLDIMRRFATTGYTPPLILITGHGDIEMAVGAMKLGAFEFLEKPFDEARLADAIRGAAGRASERQKDASRAKDLKARLESLSDRQRQVFDLAAQGASNKEIASRLGISVRTVEIHRSWMMERMGARNVAELVRIDAIIRGGSSPH